ncbi:hypothetical protein ALC53_09156 [Atta colombica]|uniref:Uncharacterized protein n=1 Tax=Atta colombica TaxID=520822 RepID=A0A151I2E7_9HYME|nr:hypothetical protein ALC53_09156 [Atta colombica]
MGETCRTECRAECRTLYREKKRTEEVISEVRREQSGAMNNGGWKSNERNESKRKRTRQAGPSTKPPPLHSSMPFIFRSRQKSERKKDRSILCTEVTRVKHHNLKVMIIDTRNYSARDSTFYSKNVLANILIYPLVDMIYSFIYIIYLIIYVKLIKFILYFIIVLLVNPPSHVIGISYDTYEKGAAFREGQSSDWSSGMRRSQEIEVEENDIDTAPKPWAHNCRYREEKRGTRAKVT